MTITTRVSEERLGELIEIQANHGGNLAAFRWQTVSALRELRERRELDKECGAYLQHTRRELGDGGCKKNYFGDDRPCTCGLDALRTKLAAMGE